MPRLKKVKIRNYETASVLADMLTENTGTHMLDSGGASGRAWQRNQAAVAKTGKGPVAFFESQPESVFGWPCVNPHPNFREEDSKLTAELWVNHSVYHWLKEAVTYAPEVDKLLDELAAEMDEGHDEWSKPSWFEIYREFPEWYAKRQAHERAEEERETRRAGGYDEAEIAEVSDDDYYSKPGGIYGDGDWVEGYTYNEENCLSQDIHWIFFRLEDDNRYDDGIALIMIHGGADARGGFTRPRAFYASEEGDSPTFFDWSRYGIACDNTDCRAMWSGNGGYEESAEWNDSDYADHEVLALSEYDAREGDAGEPGVIVIDQPGEYPSSEGTKVFCPVCGTGTLSPWFY